MSDLKAVPIPPRMQSLPIDKHGRPIPWFVETLPDGSRDFRVASAARRVQALRFGNCWVCGSKVGRYAAFPIGPMCAVNRVTAEPPCHRECAIYSARACPFLATPAMVRRTTGLPDKIGVPGKMIARNPGAVLVWVTTRWHTFRAPGGALISLGDPTETLWFAEGRQATAEQARAAIDSGMPIIRAEAEKDSDPELALAALDKEYAAALRLLPA